MTVFIITLDCLILGRRRSDSPPGKKAKQEETQTSKMQPLQSKRSEQEQATPRGKL